MKIVKSGNKTRNLEEELKDPVFETNEQVNEYWTQTGCEGKDLGYPKNPHSFTLCNSYNKEPLKH